MAKTSVGNLPEVSEVKDNDILLCSTDNKHVQKVKAKNVKGTGGGSGGLSYWKETDRAFYKDTNTDPTEMNAIVVRKEGGLIDGHQWDYYEVFGHKFGFQVPVEGEADYSSLERARKFALRNALSMASTSTDGHNAQPSDYTMPNVYEVSGLDHYTSQYVSTLPDRFSPYVSAEDMEENATGFIATDKAFAYRYPGPGEPKYMHANSAIYCGYITLDMFNADGDICTNQGPGVSDERENDEEHPLGYSLTPLTGDQNIDSGGYTDIRPTGQSSTIYLLRGIYAERARDRNYGNYDHKDVRFLFFLCCHGKDYGDGDNPDDYTLDTTETASYGLNFVTMKKQHISTSSGYADMYGLGSEQPCWKVHDGSADRFVYFRDRTRNMSCMFVDDNGVKWSFSIGYDPDCSKIQPYGQGDPETAYPPYGIYESIYPDFTLPNGVQDLDLGYIPHHPCYYEGANPIDENGELSDASHAIYKQNIVDLGKAVKNALGLRSTPAVLEGEIPGGISYKVRTELVNDDANMHRSYSAGTMDGEGNYTETVGIDPINGDILLNNQSIKQMIAGSVDVTPVLQQGTKIATINQNDIFAPTPTDVVGNPTGTAATDLEKLQIGNDIYKIPTGGGATEYSTDPVKVGKWIDGRDVWEITLVNDGSGGTIPTSGNITKIYENWTVLSSSDFLKTIVLDVRFGVMTSGNNLVNCYPGGYNYGTTNTSNCYAKIQQLTTNNKLYFWASYVLGSTIGTILLAYATIRFVLPEGVTPPWPTT